MFWGLTMEPQKRYTQIVADAFHISHAALDVSELKEESSPTQVMVEFENNSYLIASLSKAVKIYQVPLDLNFEQGDQVSFRAVGPGTVHLTGYHVRDDEDMEDRLMAEFNEGEESEEETENSSMDDSMAQLGKRKKALVAAGKSKKSKLESSDEEDEDSLGSTLGDSTLLELEAAESDGEEDDDDDDGFDGIDEEDSDEEETEESEENDDDSDGEEEQESPKPAKMMNGNTPNNKKAKGAGKTPEPEPKAKGKKELNQSQQQTPKQGKTPKAEKTPKGEKGAEKTPKSEKKTPKQKDGATPKQEKGKKTPGGASPQKKVLAGGVIAEEIKAGDGTLAKSGKIVQVYYVGRLKSNNKQFDATTGGPGLMFRLGRGEVVRGWDIGVEGMRVGGKRRLTIPAALAYGAKGNPPVIPPNSTLVFDVELRNVK